MKRTARILAMTLAAISCATPSAPTPDRTPIARHALSLAPASGDVWAWTVDLHGEGDAPLAACSAGIGDAMVPVRAKGGTWSGTVHLAPGVNEIHAECRDDRGAVHRSDAVRFVAKLPDVPRAVITFERSGEGARLDARASRPSEGLGRPIVSFDWRIEDGAAKPVRGEGPTLVVPAVPEGSERPVRLRVRDSGGKEDESTILLTTLQGATLPVDGRSVRAHWTRDAVVYGVYPPLFGSPPLRAVTRALADIAGVGANVVWLTPIFKTLPGDFGYAVTDYFEVRPDYGSEDDLRALVTESHRLGLRIILDMVPNHTSSHHRYFVDADMLGVRSRYFAFYARDAAGAPTHYFDWENLPNLDYQNAEIGRFILAASTRWMHDFGIDGYRLDAAWGVRARGPLYLGEWASEMRRIDPDAFLVAEASARDPYYVEEGFDAAYDWTETLGAWAWASVWDDPAQIPERLDAALAASRAAEPLQSRVLRFLENNDTGARFITRHGAALTRVAAAALLTLPGVPCLFTGEERGAEYEPYASTSPLGDADPHALRAWHARLVALRHARPSLRSDTMARARVSPAPSRVYAYRRSDAPSGEATLVVLSFDVRPTHVSIALDPGEITAWRDLFTGIARVPRRGALDIDLPSWGVAILGRDR